MLASSYSRSHVLPGWVRAQSFCNQIYTLYVYNALPSYSARTKVLSYPRYEGTKVNHETARFRASLLFVQRGRAKRSARRPRRLRSRRVRPRPTASDRRALDVVPRARASPRAAQISSRPRDLTPRRCAKKNSPRDVLRGQAPHQGHPELLPGE